MLGASAELLAAAAVISLLYFTEAGLSVVIVFHVRVQQQYEAFVRVVIELIETTLVLVAHRPPGHPRPARRRPGHRRQHRACSVAVAPGCAAGSVTCPRLRLARALGLLPRGVAGRHHPAARRRATSRSRACCSCGCGARAEAGSLRRGLPAHRVPAAVGRGGGQRAAADAVAARTGADPTASAGSTRAAPRSDAAGTIPVAL